MYHNITGSLAEKLNDLNPNLIISEHDIENLTFTPYVENDYLHTLLSNTLNEVEKETKIQQKKLFDLKQLLLLVPSDDVRKDEYESRLKSLNNLYNISNELDTIVNNEGVLGEELELKISQLDASLKVSNHGPLRNLLENELMKIKSTIQTQPKEEVNEGNLVKWINSSQSAEAIDEIFCELSLEEYINQGKKGREIIANQFFDQSKSYKLNTEVKDDLKRFIDKFKESNYKIISEEAGKAISQESYKNTLNVKELELLM
ncbi:hypothetical protein JNUCC23_21020 [Peribacillus sp. JNUCC 23]